MASLVLDKSADELSFIVTITIDGKELGETPKAGEVLIAALRAVQKQMTIESQAQDADDQIAKITASKTEVLAVPVLKVVAAPAVVVP